MSLRINQNILAVRSHGQLSLTSGRMEKSIEKLSSGLRINRSADDAAGLAISEKMRRQIRGLSRATLNAQDGISMIQVAEGAMGEAQANLHRMRELAIQAGNDTLTSNDRLEIQKEIEQLKDDLNRIAFNTEFNTKRLLDGSQAAFVSSSSQYSKGIVKDLAAGGDYQISLYLLESGVSEMLRSQTFTNKFDGSLAQGETQFRSIVQFYDSNRVFALDDPQEISIRGNGKSTKLNVEGSTTLAQFAAALGAAIQLESGLEVPNSRVNAVTTATTSISDNGGYIEITSGIIGEIGKISFSGDNAMMNALGFQATREAVNSTVRGTAIDGEGKVYSETTNDNRIIGILNGVDVKFSSQAAQVASSGVLVEGIYISVDSTFSISSIGGNPGLQISGTISAGNWTMPGLERYIDSLAVAAGVTGFDTTIADSQLRFSYAPSSISLSSTFYLTGWNAGGIENLGFTDGIKAGMVTGNRDETKNVWGFSRYQATGTDTVIFSISDGVTTTDITLMTTTSAVSTADLVSFSSFQASVVSVFEAVSVQIAIDQIDSSIVFTHRYLGRQINDTAPDAPSRIQISVVASANTEAMVKNVFGFEDNTLVEGIGETNFRFHVVSNQPQFHIGADQGQVMKVTMGDISVNALNLENLDLTSISGASKALGRINKALDLVSGERSKLGAFQNRLEYTINNLRSMHGNMSAAESRLRDADIAQEMIEFTRDQIMNQSGTAMLAQANIVPQGVLQLLK